MPVLFIVFWIWYLTNQKTALTNLLFKQLILP